MKILVDFNKLKHLKEISSYNKNYYELPFSIDMEHPMDIIADIRGLDEEFNNYAIGYWSSMSHEFIPLYYLNIDEVEKNRFFTIDFDKITVDNNWT